MYVTDTSYVDNVKSLLRRRLTGEPLAYVTGSCEFYGLPMNVTPDVLIPRVDTEVLAAKCIEFCTSRGQTPMRVLELCTGSGCVGIALAAHARNTHVLMTDVSQKALAVARSNILKNGVSQTARCMEIDALAEPDRRIGEFDLIIANPPYIPHCDIPGLDRGVKDYEPHLALDGGVDGLDFYRAITANYKPLLRPGGGLYYEVGIRQAMRVAALMQGEGFTGIGFTQDTIGVDRVVCGILE